MSTESTKTVYLSKLDNERLTIMSRHTGYPASTLIAIAINYLYEAETSEWPMRIPQSIRESLQMVLIQNGETLKEWVYREGEKLSTVNAILDRLDKGQKVGWTALSEASRVVDKLEILLGRDDLRFICQDPNSCFDKNKGEY